MPIYKKNGDRKNSRSGRMMCQSLIDISKEMVRKKQKTRISLCRYQKKIYF